MIRAFWQRVMARVVADVPAAVAFCEFDCRNPTCELGRFATCPRRLTGAAREEARKAG